MSGGCNLVIDISRLVLGVFGGTYFGHVLCYPCDPKNMVPLQGCPSCVEGCSLEFQGSVFG